MYKSYGVFYSLPSHGSFMNSFLSILVFPGRMAGKAKPGLVNK